MSDCFSSPSISAKLTGLPDAGLCSVLGFLDTHDALKCRRVCKPLRSFLDTSSAAWLHVVFEKTLSGLQSKLGPAGNPAIEGSTAPHPSLGHFERARAVASTHGTNATALGSILMDYLPTIDEHAAKLRRTDSTGIGCFLAALLPEESLATGTSTSDVEAVYDSVFAASGDHRVPSRVHQSSSQVHLACHALNCARSAQGVVIDEATLHLTTARVAALARAYLQTLHLLAVAAARNSFGCISSWTQCCTKGVGASGSASSTPQADSHGGDQPPSSLLSPGSGTFRPAVSLGSCGAFTSFQHRMRASTGIRVTPPTGIAPNASSHEVTAHSVLHALQWLVDWDKRNGLDDIGNAQHASSKIIRLAGAAAGDLLGFDASQEASSAGVGDADMSERAPLAPAIDAFAASVIFQYEATVSSYQGRRVAAAAAEAAAEKRRAVSHNSTSTGSAHAGPSFPDLSTLRIGLTIDIRGAVLQQPGFSRITPTGIIQLVGRPAFTFDSPSSRAGGKDDHGFEAAELHIGEDDPMDSSLGHGLTTRRARSATIPCPANHPLISVQNDYAAAPTHRARSLTSSPTMMLPRQRDMSPLARLHDELLGCDVLGSPPAMMSPTSYLLDDLRSDVTSPCESVGSRGSKRRAQRSLSRDAPRPSPIRMKTMERKDSTHDETLSEGEREESGKELVDGRSDDAVDKNVIVGAIPLNTSALSSIASAGLPPRSSHASASRRSTTHRTRASLVRRLLKPLDITAADDAGISSVEGLEISWSRSDGQAESGSALTPLMQNMSTHEAAPSPFSLTPVSSAAGMDVESASRTPSTVTAEYDGSTPGGSLDLLLIAGSQLSGTVASAISMYTSIAGGSTALDECPVQLDESALGQGRAPSSSSLTSNANGAHWRRSSVDASSGSSSSSRVIAAAGSLFSRLGLWGGASPHCNERSTHADQTNAVAASPSSPLLLSPLASLGKLHRWFAESFSESKEGNGEDEPRIAVPTDTSRSRSGIAQSDQGMSSRRRRVNSMKTGSNRSTGRQQQGSTPLLAPKPLQRSLSAPPVPPPSYLSRFDKSRVSFLSVHDGWVVAQTSAGLAAAFPLQLPADHPLACQIATASDARLLPLILSQDQESASSTDDMDRSLTWPCVYLNLESGHLMHCAYINKSAEPPSLITCVSDETLQLKCFVVPLPALVAGQDAVSAASRRVFADDIFRHPGFVEFNSVSNCCLTYGLIGIGDGQDGAMHFKVWELSAFSELVCIPDAGVVDVKFSQGALVVTHSGAVVADIACSPATVRVDFALDLSNGALAAQFDRPLEEEQRRKLQAASTQLRTVTRALAQPTPPPSAQSDAASSTASDGGAPHPHHRLLTREMVHPSSELWRDLTTSAGHGSIVAVTVYSLRSGCPSATLAVAIMPGCAIQLLEVFAGLLLLKQTDQRLRVIDVVTGRHLSVVSQEAFPTPFAQVFLYQSHSFLAVYPSSVELRHADGSVACRMTGPTAKAVHDSLLGCQQTGTNMHISHDETTMLALGHVPTPHTGPGSAEGLGPAGGSSSDAGGATGGSAVYHIQLHGQGRDVEEVATSGEQHPLLPALDASGCRSVTPSSILDVTVQSRVEVPVSIETLLAPLNQLRQSLRGKRYCGYGSVGSQGGHPALHVTGGDASLTSAVATSGGSSARASSLSRMVAGLLSPLRSPTNGGAASAGSSSSDGLRCHPTLTAGAPDGRHHRGSGSWDALGCASIASARGAEPRQVSHGHRRSTSSAGSGNSATSGGWSSLASGAASIVPPPGMLVRTDLASGSGGGGGGSAHPLAGFKHNRSASQGSADAAGRVHALTHAPSPAPARTTTIKYDEASGLLLTADEDGLVHVWVQRLQSS